VWDQFSQGKIVDPTNIPEAKSRVLDGSINALTDIDITPEIVASHIKSLKKNKAAGEGGDGLAFSFLREVEGVIVKPLVMIFSKSLDDGVVPYDWRVANVTPIFKKGSKKDPANYRPVRLTSQIGKIFERIVKAKIMNFLEINHLINNSQHGFRSGRSCLTNLLEFMENVLQHIDEGRPVDEIFLNFQKAFDKVLQMRLLEKIKVHGIGVKIHTWIEKWLTGRH